MSVVQSALTCAIDIIDIRMTSCVGHIHDNMLLIISYYITSSYSAIKSSTFPKVYRDS